MNNFKVNVLNALIEDLKKSSLAIAAWECGSAANGTTDQYSDIDLRIVGSESVENIFNQVESTLERISKITHRLVEVKQFWPGCFQRVYFLENAPKHFFVDIAVFLKTSDDLLTEFLQQERHGIPVVHFDKTGIVRPRPANPALILERHKNRLEEIEAAFPVYKTEVLKELDRDHAIDAISFYLSAMVRPLVEVMGMLHRPFQYDFGLRYLHKAFPESDQRTIENLLYVNSSEELRGKALLAECLFRETADKVRAKLQQK